jgi:hypothetical protein
MHILSFDQPAAIGTLHKASYFPRHKYVTSQAAYLQTEKRSKTMRDAAAPV